MRISDWSSDVCSSDLQFSLCNSGELTMISSGRYADKIAVVTGGAQGIGLAVAAQMAREGATVTIADRAEDATMAAVSGLDRKRVGTGESVSLRVDSGGGRIIKKKKKQKHNKHE